VSQDRAQRELPFWSDVSNCANGLFKTQGRVNGKVFKLFNIHFIFYLKVYIPSFDDIEVPLTTESSSSSSESLSDDEQLIRVPTTRNITPSASGILIYFYLTF